jgi:hypothetical protein
MAEDARQRLMAILEHRTKPPITYREFLAYLEGQTSPHQYNEFIPLTNFYEWITSYRRYFETLPVEERVWSPEPTSDLHASYPDRPPGTPRFEYSPEIIQRQPYRAEMEMALELYITSTLFSDQAVEAVNAASSYTTHPNVFTPAIEDTYRKLTPEAARFVRACVPNIRPSTRLSRITIVLAMIVISLTAIACFIWAKLTLWIRIIPLVPLTVAVVVLPIYLRRICIIRYWSGVMHRPTWDIQGYQNEGPYLVIEEPRIILAQQRIVWSMAGVGVFISMLIWIAILLLP